MSEISSNASSHQFTNRLAQETSPYLLQHQHNPVDWYPWGPEAFERARREQKPIFLSVGYSTCYWCHVMERQSFEIEQIAEVMNRLFVCIKVDREERPDVDQLYMNAVQLIARQGGWPMSVFLTPEREPFYGGTYYPPTDSHGRPGFPRICQAVHDAWVNRRSEVQDSCRQIVSILQQVSRPRAAESPLTIDAREIGTLIDRSVADYEPHFGGFGNAPKFPRETLLEFLLAYLASDWNEQTMGSRTPRDKVRRMTLHTLDAMMHGGIRDHLGGGFHRYSTDAKWLVPHFEIMLYDNAMLLACYAEAHRQSGDARYAQVARDCADFVLREMTSPDGAFYTAMDAEVEGQEGLNYLWTEEEVVEALGPADAETFNRVYGLAAGPNFADPHHGAGVPDKNILFLANTTAVEGSPLLDPHLRQLRQKLYEVRSRRKQPLLDTKVLTSWNAQMIRGLAIAGRVLKESRYLDAAARCADFLLSQHRTPDGGLYRTSRDGVKKYAGFLDDYAYLAWALTDLAQSTGDANWRGEAEKLMDAVQLRFGDPENAAGYFFTDRAADDLIVRQKTASDSPLPSGNAAAAMALLALGRLDAATQTLAAFAPSMLEQGEAMSSLLQAAMLRVQRGGAFVVEPPPAVRPSASATSLADAAKSAVEVTARRESSRRIVVRLQIQEGWHVNAHDPGAAGVIGTTITVDPSELSLAVNYPAGEPLNAAFATEPVLVYSANTEIPINVSRDLAAGENVRITVRYQACDESSCLPPAQQTVELR